MNASYEWLREFVPFALSPEELRDLLTSRVATVEDLIRLRADLDQVVVGRVVEAAPHPNSDHLWVTKVDAGEGALLDVVCGAPNVVVGALYPFAAVGTTLPGGLKLEKRKIRGEVSEGMLLSARELALGTDHTGIMQLDVDAAPGTRFLDVVAVGDTRLVIDVLPNRPDLLSHEGLAREIAAATNLPLGAPPIARGTDASTLTGDRSNPVSVEVEDKDGCPRYMAALIQGVTIGPSPSWLSAKIEAVGSRSINNVVDATNYMLHGFGQPTHAFDMKNLEGERIIVRRARPGEKIKTLDGVDRNLDADMTVIADAVRAQAIAGVIGGEGSEVTGSTTDILLEVASFDARRIRSTRRKLGISTDASYRFERGVDAHSLDRHLRYAVDLIVAVAGGTLATKPTDVSAKLSLPLPVEARVARINAVLGDPIPADEISSLLESIGFAVTTENGGESLSVTPPSWRRDVVGEVEVIEEVARLHGYDAFPSDIRPFRPSAVPDAPLHIISDRVRRACVASGLLEARPLPFTRIEEETSIRVRNPLAEDEAFLRQNILDTLAGRAGYNLAHMERNVRLFEIGAVFSRAEPAQQLPREEIHVGALIMGARRPPHFTEPKPPHYDEWDAKALAESIGEAAFPGHVITCVKSETGVLWNVTAGDARVGVVRRISVDAPAWAAPAYGVEIDLQALGAGVLASLTLQPSEGASGAKKEFVAIPVMPAVEVDLALVVPDSRMAAEVERVIRQSAGDLLERLVLFDEFRGAGIPDGSRSLAWALTFRHSERTLRDREVQGRTAKIVKSLEDELGVKQRTG
ncbi:MAG: phenylalanine--tRNA ligase subunit beta [Gemmatimonadaceae bacterium]